MKWFRLYSETLYDPKVQRLKSEVFKFWINCLCLANDGKERGVLPSVDDIAFATRLSVDKTQAYISELLESELLERNKLGQLAPHNWERRQRKSDNVSERVKDHRNKKNVTLHETLHDDGGNVSVTPRAREETETDSDSDSLSLSVRASESMDAHDSEPFIPPSGPAVALSPEWRALAETCEQLFPGSDFPILCSSSGMDPVRSLKAVVAMKGRNKCNWSYLQGIYKNTTNAPDPPPAEPKRIRAAPKPDLTEEEKAAKDADLARRLAEFEARRNGMAS